MTRETARTPGSEWDSPRWIRRYISLPRREATLSASGSTAARATTADTVFGWPPFHFSGSDRAMSHPARPCVTVSMRQIIFRGSRTASISSLESSPFSTSSSRMVFPVRYAS